MKYTAGESPVHTTDLLDSRASRTLEFFLSLSLAAESSILAVISLFSSPSRRRVQPASRLDRASTVNPLRVVELVHRVGRLLHSRLSPRSVCPGRESSRVHALCGERATERAVKVRLGGMWGEEEDSRRLRFSRDRLFPGHCLQGSDYGRRGYLGSVGPLIESASAALDIARSPIYSSVSQWFQLLRNSFYSLTLRPCRLADIPSRTGSDSRLRMSDFELWRLSCLVFSAPHVRLEHEPRKPSHREDRHVSKARCGLED